MNGSLVNCNNFFNIKLIPKIMTLFHTDFLGSTNLSDYQNHLGTLLNDRAGSQFGNSSSRGLGRLK